MDWNIIKKLNDFETLPDIHTDDTSHGVLLSSSGLIVRDVWMEINKQFPMVTCDDFIIMPNHFHGIINMSGSAGTMKKAGTKPNQNSKGNLNDNLLVGMGGITGIHNPMLSENLGRIIRWFKGKSSRNIRKFNPEFKWQSRFYDHVIHNPEAYQRIVKYMMENPSRWAEDKMRTNKLYYIMKNEAFKQIQFCTGCCAFIRGFRRDGRSFIPVCLCSGFQTR
jgi:putative transposase